MPKFFLFHISKRMMDAPIMMTIDLPKEVMELVYRQALIWVAAFYVPLIYPIGVIAHVAVFFVKCISRHLPPSPAISRHLPPSRAISSHLPPLTPHSYPDPSPLSPTSATDPYPHPHPKPSH